MNKITKVTRKGILFDLLKVSIDIDKIILDFFLNDDLPSSDSRYIGLNSDYNQHRINNNDWEDDWFIEDDRFDFYGMTDKMFLDFLEFVINQVNIEKNDIYFVLQFTNDKLIRDGFELKAKGSKVNGRNIFEGGKILGGEEKINFYTIIPKGYLQYLKSEEQEIFPYYKGPIEYPCIILEYNSRDDFGWRTSFIGYFYVDDINRYDLGNIKILDSSINSNKYEHIVIPKSFNKLPNNFCSVFNSSEGLNELNLKGLRLYKKTILKSLNEVTYNKAILRKFKLIPGFSKSLLRDSDTFSRISNNENRLLNFGVKNKNGDIYFDFDENELPNRINLLIGKNGCGKTSLLSNIATELVEYNEENTLLINRPSFSQIIQVSYSVFDNFTIPNKSNLFKSKYIYCGLRYEENEINILSLQRKLISSLDKIKEKSKESVYTYLLNDLLDTSGIKFNQIQEEYIKYSSGQKILITILAQIIENIDENSLLLFDEPETHLHPNMIFKLVKVLYNLLDDNNSYLIMATHSPIVLQQVPSKYVRILDSYGNKKLNLECFGANFSEITKEIFGNYEADDVIYKKIFTKLMKKKYTEEEVLDFFDGKLTLNARIYLKALYNNKNKGEI